MSGVFVFLWYELSGNFFIREIKLRNDHIFETRKLDTQHFLLIFFLLLQLSHITCRFAANNTTFISRMMKFSLLVDQELEIS